MYACARFGFGSAGEVESGVFGVQEAREVVSDSRVAAGDEVDLGEVSGEVAW